MLSFKKIYKSLYVKVTVDKNYEISNREAECLMYNYIIKSLPEDHRNEVSNCLYRIIKRYQIQVTRIHGKSITFKPKTVPGTSGAKIYIYDLDSLPDPLSDIIILCLREYIFPA